MGKFEQKTIRDPLLGMVTDHLQQGHISCGITCQVGCELVALLAAYREEDRRLYPEVYLFGGSADEFLNVLSPGAQRISLGSIQIEEFSATSRKVAAHALKSCAALAIDGWAIFVCRAATAFDYGLFRPATEPYSGGAEETLLSSEVAAAIFRNCAEKTVEIINSAGSRLEISLTTATPAVSSSSTHIVEFAKAACIDVEPSSREQVVGYLTRVLTETLRLSHGALLAIVPAGEVRLPPGFADGIVLTEPIALAKATEEAIRLKSGEAVSLLRSYEALLRGMIMSDGVTILGTDCSIRAFRVFVAASGPGKEGSEAVRPDGGARTRAFAVLRGHTGSKLRAALMRSEDGKTEIVVSS